MRFAFTLLASLTLAMAIGLAGCSNSGDGDKSDKGSDQKNEQKSGDNGGGDNGGDGGNGGGE